MCAISRVLCFQTLVVAQGILGLQTILTNFAGRMVPQLGNENGRAPRVAI